MVDRICDNCMSRVPSDAEKCPQCGIHFENTNPGGALPNGGVLGRRYTMGRYIDIDGEGVQYSAIDSNTLQRVTVKEFMPVTLCATRDDTGAIVPKPGCEVLFKTTRMDYTEMYKSLMRMGLTEGLVQVLDVMEENNTAYAVLEKIEGPTLAEYLVKAGAPLEEGRTTAIMRPVLIGVEALHVANVVHRGISPENIILESGGTAKLCGYATLALRQQGSEMKAKLYPGYSSPEQYAASEFEGYYTDVYALSAVMHRMLTGEVPTAADERKVQDTLRAPRMANKNIPAYLSTALMRGMRLAPAERLQNVSELRLALSGEGSKETRGFLGLTQQQLVVGACAAGAILLLIIVLVFVLIFGKNNDEPASSISEVSSVSAVAEVMVPDFTGKLYADVVKDKQYKDKFTFASEYEEEFSDSVAEGRIISQTPEKDTAWDEKPIKFVLSKGVETVDMPDFVGKMTTKEEAIAKLKELGIEKYVVYGRVNDGAKQPGQVLETDPVAGTKVSLSGEKEIVLYVANEISSVNMPNLIGLSFDAAVAKMTELGIKYNDTKWEDNDGRYAPNTVIAQDKSPDASVTIASDHVTITMSRSVINPPIVGKTLEDARKIISEMKIKVTLVPIPEVTNSSEAGKIFKTDKEGVVLVDGDVIEVYIAEAPPPVASSSSSSSSSEAG